MTFETIALLFAVVVAVILLGFALIVLWKVWTNKIDLTYLVSETKTELGEAKPKASLSRFQFLIFTFVIAGLFFLLSIEAGTFVDVPESVLGLLGISAGGYVVSKGIGKSGEKPDGK